jgi:ferritin
MIPPKVQTALNNQLNEEMFASYSYLAMSAYFESHDLNGFSGWFRAQSAEEYGHAMKIFDYIHQTGGKVTLKDIKPPKTNWKAHLDVFKDMYAAEQKVTKSINSIVDLSGKEKDYATNNFLQWFVSEQVEEEATAQKLLKRMQMVGNNLPGLLMMDRELGMRATQQ